MSSGGGIEGILLTDVGLGGEVQHRVDLLLLEDVANKVVLADVPLVRVYQTWDSHTTQVCTLWDRSSIRGGGGGLQKGRGQAKL